MWNFRGSVSELTEIFQVDERTMCWAMLVLIVVHEATASDSEVTCDSQLEVRIYFQMPYFISLITSLSPLTSNHSSEPQTRVSPWRFGLGTIDWHFTVSSVWSIAAATRFNLNIFVVGVFILSGTVCNAKNIRLSQTEFCISGVVLGLAANFASIFFPKYHRACCPKLWLADGPQNWQQISRWLHHFCDYRPVSHHLHISSDVSQATAKVGSCCSDLPFLVYNGLNHKRKQSHWVFW